MRREVGFGNDGRLVGRMVHQIAKKTLILPVHSKIATKKLKIPRRLAVRWIYSVQLCPDKLLESNASLRDLYDAIADITGLNKPYT